METINFKGQDIACHPRVNIVTGKHNVGKSYFLSYVFSNAEGDLKNHYSIGLNLEEDVPYTEIFEDEAIRLKIVEVLKAIDSDIADFKRTPDYCSIKYSDGTYEDLWCSGSTLVSVIRIISYLPLVKGHIYIIDDFAVSLQGYAMRSFYKLLIELLERYNVQLFVSTNSLEIIDSLLQNPSSVNIIRLRKRKGKICAEVIKGVEALEYRQEYCMDLRQ